MLKSHPEIFDQKFKNSNILYLIKNSNIQYLIKIQIFNMSSKNSNIQYLIKNSNIEYLIKNSISQNGNNLLVDRSQQNLDKVQFYMEPIKKNFKT